MTRDALIERINNGDTSWRPTSQIKNGCSPHVGDYYNGSGKRLIIGQSCASLISRDPYGHWQLIATASYYHLCIMWDGKLTGWNYERINHKL